MKMHNGCEETNKRNGGKSGQHPHSPLNYCIHPPLRLSPARSLLSFFDLKYYLDSLDTFRELKDP
jgi:hypothetical protein